MKLLLASFLIFGLSLYFESCTSSNCSCYQGKVDTTNLKIQQCNFSITKKRISFPKQEFENNNWFFGQCLYERNDSFYLVHVTLDKQIKFINLFDSTDSHRSMYPYDAGENHIAEMKTFNDTLILVLKDDKKAMKLQINPDFTTSLIKKIDLGKFLSKESYIRFNNGGKQFDYKYPYLLLPYGKIDGINFYDKRSHLLINTNALTAQNILDFPSCYSSCYVQGESPSAAMQRNKIAGLFSFYGEFKELDLMKESVAAIQIPNSKPFVEFDKKEIRNIAYARKYDLLSEMNTNIFFLQDGAKVIIRRLAKKAFSDHDRFQYFVYNQDNILECTDLFPMPIENLLMRPYKNGFVVFNDSLSQALFYEKN